MFTKNNFWNSANHNTSGNSQSFLPPTFDVTVSNFYRRNPMGTNFLSHEHSHWSQKVIPKCLTWWWRRWWKTNSNLLFKWSWTWEIISLSVETVTLHHAFHNTKVLNLYEMSRGQSRDLKLVYHTKPADFDHLNQKIHFWKEQKIAAVGLKIKHFVR